MRIQNSEFRILIFVAGQLLTAAPSVHQRAGNDFVGPIQLQFARFGIGQQVDEVQQVARVERARIGRYGRWRLDGARIFTPCRIVTTSASLPAQLPPCFGRQGRLRPSPASCPERVVGDEQGSGPTRE